LQPPHLTDGVPIADAVDDNASIVASQKLDDLEASDGRLNQVCLGIAQQFIDAPRDPQAGGVVTEDGIAQSQN
jgi:hypothetical protein